MAEDRLKIRAENRLIEMERRFGVAATYFKRSPDVEDEDGNITPGGTSIPCTLVPKAITQEDMQLAGMNSVETQMKAFIGRQSVLGLELSRGDTVTIDAVTYEVREPVLLDAYGKRWRIIARKIT